AMKTTLCCCFGSGILVLSVAVLAGCSLDLEGKGGKSAGNKQNPGSSSATAGDYANVPTGQNEQRPEPPALDPKKPVLPAKGKIVPFGKNVFVEFLAGDKRRVLVNAYVCRRTDLLEQLLCRKDTKEHEAILASEVDARLIHGALIVAKAKAGSTVQFAPKY